VRLRLLILGAALSPAVPAPAEGAPTTPVIFVHGLNRSVAPGSDCDKDFSRMRGAFRRWGHRGGFTSVAYYRNDSGCDHWINHHGRHRTHYGGGGEHFPPGKHSANTDIRHLGYHLAWFIWEHYSRQGTRVDVVGHSMGGLIIRYAIAQTQRDHPRFPPFLNVRDVVTLGTPHGGARWYAIGCPYDQCQQMRAGSDFLVWLERNAWNPQGACHKVWYRESTDIEHSEFLTITTKRPTAAVFRRNCPHRFVADATSHWPVRRAYLAVTSSNY
jgi:pimeloyl-ACP methyl ester carboxylesterase